MTLKLRIFKRIALVICMLAISNHAFSQVTINESNFGTDFDIWNDGGTYAGRTINGSYFCDNIGAIFVRYTYNFDTSSNVSSDPLDLTPYTAVDISFCLTTLNIDDGEGFDLQYFNGVAWLTVRNFRRGVDFNGNISAPNGVNFTTTLSSCDYFMANNARFRFIGRSGSTNEFAIFDDIKIEGYTTGNREIGLEGNAIAIDSGDTMPNIADGTDFDEVITTGATATNTFVIQNTGAQTLNLTGVSPYISITGANASDFTVTSIPSNSIAGCSSTNFDITFDPSDEGLRTATVTIANNDADEGSYTFDIQGTGKGPCDTTIIDFPYYEGFESDLGDWEQDTLDTLNWTRFSGGTPSGGTGPNQAANGNWYAYIEATFSFNLTANLISPCFDLSSMPIPFLAFNVYMYGAEVDTLNLELSTDFGATYSSVLWTQTGQIQTNPAQSWLPVTIDLSAYAGQTIKLRFNGHTGNDFTSDIAIDDIQLFDNTPLTEGPGGVTSNLKLWLKSTDGLGYNDGDAVVIWEDQGKGSDARVNLPGQEPSYRDNVNDNINFNPTIDFVNNTRSIADPNFNDSGQQFLSGGSGYYTQDIFIVSFPDQTISSGTGSRDMLGADDPRDSSFDVAGIGFGQYTVRHSNEVITYAIGNSDGYGRANSSNTQTYNEPSIINARNNSVTAPNGQELYFNARQIGNTTANSTLFKNLNNEEFWLGRSEYWRGSYDGKIAEVVTYSARKDDTNLTQERNRIASYLAIKYGITLGTNGTSQDYVNSDGDLIWDANTGVAANDAFNYDIAGIGRDDDSDLLQKQSRSVNNALDGGFRAQGVLTMGISSIADTNSANLDTSLNDKEFLVWGNNGVDLDTASTPHTVNMSSAISPALTTDVSFTTIQRTWKVVETGGDISDVEVQILRSAVRTATPPSGEYLMFISDSPVFDPTADFEVMVQTTNELGEEVLSTTYDFDGTRYITLGWAPELTFEGSIYFNGTTDYIDIDNNLELNPSEFSISAWIKRDASDSGDASIVSKRASGFADGYDLRIRNNNRIQMIWKNGSNQSITSDTAIPDDEWHHIAVTYNGAAVSIYIDGVLDKTRNRTAPTPTDESFIIGAGGKTSTNSFFQGNIDEVRVWSTMLTQSQLRFVMNQEIEDNANFVGGSYFINRGITPTQNDVDTIDWNNLEGYYPMSTYVYTNTKDQSGKGNTGSLRNLRTVDRQTAPLPYRSTQNGSWDANTTWLNGNLQTIPGTTSIVDNTVSVDWNIVETSHNITIDDASDLPSGNNDNRSVLGLLVDSNTLTLSGNTTLNTGTGLTITHYLNLDGNIDLNGESQLIQSLNSDLEVSSSGRLDRDQQGTRDLYTYNYWSSPVGTASTTINNTSYTLPTVLRNGTNPASPSAITFLTTGYDGNITGLNISISDYWIWKFNNLPDDDFASWQHIRSTGTMLAGEGYTMKGVTDTSGNVSLDQNYVFTGKPNNGVIELDIDDNNDYLVGNPYASAIDAHTFITDNGPAFVGDTPTITGTLYFWEHWGGGSHVLSEYQGGYATYNFSGGVAAVSVATLDPDVDQSGTSNGTKLPGQYIPVSQGFFVVGSKDNAKINFNNGQRVFVKEATGTSVFVEANDESIAFGETQENTAETSTINSFEDSRRKIRLGFDSVNTYHRQLLVTEDSNATIDVDWGYDGQLNEEQVDDMFWIIENDSYVIQGVNEFSAETILPIGIETSTDGITTILIDALENFDNATDIYLHDKELQVYHDLKESNYAIFLNAGEYLDRFEITFSTGDLLSITTNTQEVFEVTYTNSIESIVINNPTLKDIRSVKLLSILGQEIYANDAIATQNTTTLKVSDLSTGAYIINIKTRDNQTISKKVLVK